MKKITRREQIHAVLKFFDEGLLTSEIASLIGISGQQVWGCIKKPARAPWCYIDRWTVVAKTSGWCAVWCYCESKTRDCPKPERSAAEVWREMQVSA